LTNTNIEQRANVRNSFHKRFHLSGNTVTLAGVTVKGAPDIAQRMRELLSKQTARILATHGPRAFEMPKTAACVHEAGHAVVATWLGKTVTRVGVHECPVGWAGYCHWEGGNWRLEPSNTAGMIELARSLYAGLAAELMWADEDRREGSSLDELVMSQIAAAEAAGSDAGGEALWRTEVHGAVVQCLFRNQDTLIGVAEHLLEHNRLKGQPLREALAGVK
jgi:hypothetical protein